MFKQREPSIDALRAFALFGIIIVNLPFFAITYGFAGDLWQTSEPLWPNVVASMVIQGFFESKFILIFSALFGFSALQQFQKYGMPFYVRRLFVLALFGALNLCFLFEADILLPYAIIGALLLVLRNRPIAEILRCSVALWALAVLGIGFFGLKILVFPSPAVVHDVPISQIFESGSFMEVMQTRVESWVSFQTYCLWSNYFLVAAAMSAGYGAARYCNDHGLDALIARINNLASFMAVPALAGCLVYGVIAGLPASAGPERFFLFPMLLRPLFALPFSLVLVAAAMGIFRSSRFATLCEFLAPAGRMSLSIYLGMSLVMGLLFFGYGAGLHNHVRLVDCLWIATLIYLVLLIAARFWFRVAKRGPLETALSTLARPRRRQISVQANS